MDEIFLQDYANNTAQAQDPFGLAAVQAQPGFENYQPNLANQELQPMGLVDEKPSRLPDFRQMAENALEDTVKNYIVKKIGLEGIKGNILNSVMGTNPYVAGIAALGGVGSALTGKSLDMSNLLARKRAEKVYEMNQRRVQSDLNKQQTQAIQQRLDSEPVSNQDRNRGQAPSSPTPSAPAARQTRHTSGVGGLHSGY